MAAVAVDEGQVELWLLRPPGADTAGGTGPAPGAGPAGYHPAAEAELDHAERARAASFVRSADRARYVAAHIALRRLLGAYLGLPPRKVPLVRERCLTCGGPHGRPVVAAVDGTAPPPHFSLSHCAGLVLVAVASAPVGVDVEELPGEDRVALCAPTLHPAERAELERLPPSPSLPRREYFGRLWTRKEAYLKGIGAGLTRGLAADYLGDGDGDGGAGAPPRPPGWSVVDLPVGTGHTAAVALRSAIAPSTAVRRLPPGWLHNRDSPGLRREGIP